MNFLSFSSKCIDDSSKSTCTCSTRSATSSLTYDSLDGDEECMTCSTGTKFLSKYDDVVSIDERTVSSSLWKDPIGMEEEEKEDEEESKKKNTFRRTRSVRKSKSYSSFENLRSSTTDGSDKKNNKKKKKIQKSKSHTSLENLNASDDSEDHSMEKRKNVRKSSTSLPSSPFDYNSVDMKKIKKKKKKKKKEQQSLSSDNGNIEQIHECKCKSHASLEHHIVDGDCACADADVDADVTIKRKKKSNSIKSQTFEDEWSSSVSHSPATATKPLYNHSSDECERRVVVPPPSLQLGLLHTHTRGIYNISSEKTITTAATGESCIGDKKKKVTEIDFIQQQQQQQLVMMTEDPHPPPEVLPTTTMTLTAKTGSDAHVDDDDDENENRKLELLLLLSQRVQTTFENAPSKNFEYEATIGSCFPGGAISNETVVTDVVSVLYEKGYNIQNTHLITSFVESGGLVVCDDNDGNEGSRSQPHQSCCQLEDDFMSIYQKNHLKIGGLASLFAGTTTGLFNDMVTAQQISDDVENENDDGYYCLLVFGPHVSLAADGTISKVEQNFIDFQPTAVQELISSYGQRLAAAEVAGENRMIELPYALYDSQDRVLSELIMTQIQQQQAPTGSSSTTTSTTTISTTGTKRGCRGVAVLGGIQITTEGPKTPDYFHPLRFDYIMKNHGTTDNGDIVVEDLLHSLTSTTTVRMKTE